MLHSSKDYIVRRAFFSEVKNYEKYMKEQKISNFSHTPFSPFILFVLYCKKAYTFIHFTVDWTIKKNVVIKSVLWYVWNYVCGHILKFNTINSLKSIKDTIKN